MSNVVTRGGHFVMVVAMLFVAKEGRSQAVCGNYSCETDDESEAICDIDCGCSEKVFDDDGTILYANSCTQGFGWGHGEGHGYCSCLASCLDVGDCCVDVDICGVDDDSTCGDDVCDGDENGTDCAEDCGCEPMSPWICDRADAAPDGECHCDRLCLKFNDCCADVCTTCTAICPAGGSCGNGACSATETPAICPADCGCAAAGACGSQAPGGCWCDSTCMLIGDCCEDSCDACTVCDERCGDGVCGDNENCLGCAGDCGGCSEVCGDGTCEFGETCSTCATDCGFCAGSCGDGTCAGVETCSNCAVDCCAVCGNDTCEGSETCSTCPEDCGTGLASGVGGESATPAAGSRPKIWVRGSLLFGTGSFSGVFRGLASYGGADIPITMNDMTGDATWIKQGGSTSPNVGEGGGTGVSMGDRGFDIVASADGHVYVTGVTDSGDTWFGRGEANEAYTWSSGGDGFVAKFNASTGLLVWAKWFPYASPAYSEGRSIMMTPDGGVVITGAFNNSVTFGVGEASPVTLTAVGPTADDMNGFLAKYNSNGTLAWARRILSGNALSPPVGHGSGLAVGVDATGAIHVAGRFWNNVNFEPGPMALSSVGGWDIFLAKYNASGTVLLNVRREGGPGADTLEDLATAPDGRVRIVGSWSGASITFGQGEAGQVTFNTPGVSDLFLAGYTAANPTTLEFASSVGGADAGAYGESANGIVVGPDGRSFITGTYSDNTDFSGTVVPGIDGVGGRAAFVAKYDSVGSFEWVDYAWAREGTAAALICDGSVMVAGLGSSPSTFFPGTSFRTDVSPADIWTAKYPDWGPAWDSCDPGGIGALSGASGLMGGDDTTSLLGGPGAGNGREKTFSWVAPATGSVTFTTCGTATWDTYLSAAINSCGGTQVAGNDNACGLQSEITFAVTSGTTYYIVVGASGGQAGPFELRWYMPCGGSTSIAGLTGTIASTNVGQAGGIGCDLGGGGAGTPEKRFLWTAPAPGVVTFSTCGGGSAYQTVLTANEGMCAGSQRACKGWACSGGGSSISFVVNSGKTYTISVGGLAAATGAFSLQWYMGCGNATSIGGSAAGTTTANTTQRPGGPGCEYGTGFDNVSEKIFQWVAPSSGNVTFSTCGPGKSWTAAPGGGLGQGLTAYKQPSGKDASGSCNGVNLACDSSRCDDGGTSLTFAVTSGATYYVIVGGTESGYGTTPLSWFMGCGTLTNLLPAASGSITGDTTDRPGGPGCDRWDGGVSEKIYSWTAPKAGDVTFSTCDPAPTFAGGTGVPGIVLSVFQGGGGACTGAPTICQDPNCDDGATTTFDAVSGTTYYIVVGGFDASYGTYTLTWDQP